MLVNLVARRFEIGNIRCGQPSRPRFAQRRGRKECVTREIRGSCVAPLGWALEEAGIAYALRKLDAMAERPADYFDEQPFGWSCRTTAMIAESGSPKTRCWRKADSNRWSHLRQRC
jgi:hypothetical protein